MATASLQRMVRYGGCTLPDRSPRRRPGFLSSRLVGVRATMRGAGIGLRFHSSTKVRITGSGITIGDDVEVLGPTVIESLSRPGESIAIGSGARLKANCWINSYGGSIVVGEECLVGFGSVLFGHGGIDIGKRSMLSPYVVVVSSNHAYWRPGPLPARGFTREPIVIGSDVWIGSQTVVAAGSVIEDDVVVAAGSVVRGKLRSGYVYGGSPATPLREIGGEDDNQPQVERWP